MCPVYLCPSAWAQEKSKGLILLVTGFNYKKTDEFSKAAKYKINIPKQLHFYTLTMNYHRN